MRRPLFVLCFIAASAWAKPCPETLVASPARVVCESSHSGPRLFTCADREMALRIANFPYDAIGSWFPEGMEEHAMVKLAIEKTVAAAVADGLTRAMVWEELIARIDRKLGRSVSKSFRGREEGSLDDYFVFQGMKRFNGKAYLLVVLPSGEVYSGPVAPLEDLGNWTIHRTDLALKRP